MYNRTLTQKKEDKIMMSVSQSIPRTMVEGIKATNKISIQDIKCLSHHLNIPYPAIRSLNAT
jgi:hypothetical protein